LKSILLAQAAEMQCLCWTSFGVCARKT